MRTVVVSGYFDPLHVGHLEMIKLAKQLGDKLIVIVNNDYQTSLKKGRPFMKQEERLKIIKALRDVDKVFLSIDKDKSICESLRVIKPDIFANGGDRHQGEIPEAKICKELGIIYMAYGVLLNGLLTNKTLDELVSSNDPIIKHVLNQEKTHRYNDFILKVRRLSNETDYSVAQIVVSYILTQTTAKIVIVGSKNPHHAKNIPFLFEALDKKTIDCVSDIIRLL